MYYCSQSFTFSALNSVGWDLNVEPTSNITSVLKDRGLSLQLGQSHRKGRVFYTGTSGESKKGRKSSFWVRWRPPRLNAALQTYFSTCSLFGESAHCTWSVDGVLFVTAKHNSYMTKEWATLVYLHFLTDEKPYLDISFLLSCCNHEVLLFQCSCVWFEARREENDALNKAFVSL